MDITFRVPGNREYAYFEVKLTPGSPADNKRELRDVDAELMTLAGNTLEALCASSALGQLQGRVIEGPPVQETWETATPAPSEAPVWAQQPPQEGQGYNYQPAQPQAPQGPPQGYQQPAQQYQQAQPQQYQQAPAQAGPPGVQAPVCNHGVPRKWKAPFQSKAGRDCSASWLCQANVPQPQQCPVEWIKG